MIEAMAKELAALLGDLPGEPSLPEEDINYWLEETKSAFPEWQPWFSLIPAGRDAEFFQLGLFVRAEAEGDDLALAAIVDEGLTYSREHMKWGTDSSNVSFRTQDPFGFLPIQALRWMRFSLSIFDGDMNQQFWRTEPGKYFGVELPVAGDPIFNGTIGLLCRIYQPAYDRGQAPGPRDAPTVKAVYLIYQRWVEAGCPSAWVPEVSKS